MWLIIFLLAFIFPILGWEIILFIGRRNMRRHGGTAYFKLKHDENSLKM